MLCWIKIGITKRAPVPMKAKSKVKPMPFDSAGATRIPRPMVRAEPNLLTGSFTARPALDRAQTIA